MMMIWKLMWTGIIKTINISNLIVISLVTYNQLKHQKLDNVTLQQTNIQTYFLLRGSMQTFENYTKVRNDVNIKSKLRNGIF